jgi:hypothetical protein
MFIWLIIRLIQLIFSAKTVFLSHKKSVNSVFQPAYNSSRMGHYQLARQHMPCDIILFSLIRFPNLRERDVIMYWYLLGKGIQLVRLSLSTESAAIQQCFSLTINQQTVFSATMNQRNEQADI